MACKSLSPLPSILLVLLLFTTTDASATAFEDRISINCGAASPSVSLSHREWLGDVYPKLSFSPVTVGGISSRASVRREQAVVDPVPYSTARISSSQFSYYFRLNRGPKYIRLHFNPTEYKFRSGFFKRLEDCFSVEAGPFTLLSNFSASITARALGVNVVTKEFCVNVHENVPFSLVFTPAVSANPSQGFYAFVNGIEIISVPSSLSYCHDGDVGVQVVGQKSVVYIDSSIALEMAYRLNVRRDLVALGVGDDNIGMFRMGAAVGGRGNKVSHNTWNVSVDVGFRYLVRLHLCEIGLKMAENGSKDFMVLIDGMIAITNTDVEQGRGGDKDISWYKNYMVMVKGNKREGKRGILISLHSKDEFVGGYGPLEGFEIFKLSNHDNSLASPNPLPPTGDSLSLSIQDFLAVLGPTNAIAGIVIMITCVVSIAVNKLQQSWEGSLPEEEIMPSTKAKTLCRRFSFVEIQRATDDFHDAFFIGRGGFGKVYKGQLDNGKQIVAVKRLKSSSKQGKHEFQTEIELLSELRHVNVVSLVGYCSEKREMILVYEYVPSGSLADHLYKLARKDIISSSLSWKQRLEICIGAGRGLDYLHTGHGIIHRDIKSSNILLDENFVPKVSDFGLAKIHTGQNQASTNFKGTFGYFDPDYFRTHRLTMKSDTYSFGVVLLEVLCGRPAVEQWAEEDQRSLTMWARDKISKGDVDQIVASNLKGEISPASLKAFLRIVERCLHDEPKKRPAIAHVIINLEFALEQQENANSSVPREIASVADVLPFPDTAQPNNAGSLSPNEIEQGSVLPEQSNMKSSSPEVVENVAEDAMPFTVMFERGKATAHLTTQITVGATGQQLMTSSKTKNFTSPLKTVVKTTMRKLSRLWPLDAIRKSGKSYKKIESTSPISAPLLARYASVNMEQRDNALSGDRIGGELLSTPDLRVFSLAELKAITGNFQRLTILGEGGFGKVYKGVLKENGIESVVAVKKLNPESMQGIEEWLSEVTFLGRLSHPNLVKLLGYCMEDRQQLLVYEYLAKGSLENNLFRRSSMPLPWDIRLQILIGAARGLAFLHSLERKVIYRDFKASNLLLDESYQAKLSDFGLAKWGPASKRTHVSTRIVGTHGYAAPEYVATGHLYVKSDVYSFGVLLLEMLTGFRVIDRTRPVPQQNLVIWIKPLLSHRRKLNVFMDPRLEGQYPAKGAFQVAKLTQNCLEPEPRNRPPSQQVLDALERIQSICS